MKASELIIELKKLIEQHGDQEVVAYLDHDKVRNICYEKNSWLNDDNQAFELG